MAQQSPTGNRTILTIAIISGLAATLLAFMYLAGQGNEQAVTSTAILVAARDLPEGTLLDLEEDLVETLVPDTFTAIVEMGIAPQYADTIADQRINRTILAGTPITHGDFVAVAQLTIAPKRFALSLAVTGANGLSGLLMPGDQVKVLITRPAPKPAASATPQSQEAMIAAAISAGANDDVEKWETTAVSNESFKVLAIGRQLSPSRQQYETMFRQPGEQQELYNAVTLEVTEAQATKILAESGNGELPVTLLLCPRPVSGTGAAAR